MRLRLPYGSGKPAPEKWCAFDFSPHTRKTRHQTEDKHTHTHSEAQRLENLLLDTAGGAVAAAWVDPKVAKHISLLMRPWKSTQMRRASMILRYGWIAAATASWACKTELHSIWRQSRSQATYGRLRFQAVCCLCKSWRKIPAQLELEAPTLVSRSGDCQHTAKTTTHPHTGRVGPCTPLVFT